MAAPSRLFDNFFLAGVVREPPQDGGKGTPRLRPIIIKSFPSQNKMFNDKEEDVTRKVLLFCFPDLEQLHPTESHVDETFQFVITRSDGSRVYGYCHRVLANGTGPRFIQCLCMISSLPWYSLFASVLGISASRMADSVADLEMFLKKLIMHPVPSPNNSVILKVPRVTTHGEDVYIFARPNEREVDMTPLLENLEPSQILALWASLLLERHIIVASSSLTLLSAIVRCAASLLYPMNWEHIFIPILPRSLLDFTTAPMPYFVGVHATSIPILHSMHVQDVVLVDLDEQTLSFFPEDLALLPHSMTSKLLRHLTRQAACVKKSSKIVLKYFNDAITKIFMSYQKFIVDGKFDHNAFIQSHQPNMQKFLELFLMSQHTEQFIRKLETGDTLLFDEEIAAYQKEKSKKTSEIFGTLKKSTKKLISGNSAPSSQDIFARISEQTIIDSIREIVEQKMESEGDDSGLTFEDGESDLQALSMPRPPRKWKPLPIPQESPAPQNPPLSRTFLQSPNNSSTHKFVVTADVANQMRELGCSTDNIKTQSPSTPLRPSLSRSATQRWVILNGQLAPDGESPPHNPNRKPPPPVPANRKSGQHQSESQHSPPLEQQLAWPPTDLNSFKSRALPKPPIPKKTFRTLRAVPSTPSRSADGISPANAEQSPFPTVLSASTSTPLPPATPFGSSKLTRHSASSRDIRYLASSSEREWSQPELKFDSSQTHHPTSSSPTSPPTITPSQDSLDTFSEDDNPQKETSIRSPRWATQLNSAVSPIVQVEVPLAAKPPPQPLLRPPPKAAVYKYGRPKPKNSTHNMYSNYTSTFNLNDNSGSIENSTTVENNPIPGTAPVDAIASDLAQKWVVSERVPMTASEALTKSFHPTRRSSVVARKAAKFAISPPPPPPALVSTTPNYNNTPPSHNKPLNDKYNQATPPPTLIHNSSGNDTIIATTIITTSTPTPTNIATTTSTNIPTTSTNAATTTTNTETQPSQDIAHVTRIKEQFEQMKRENVKHQNAIPESPYKGKEKPIVTSAMAPSFTPTRRKQSFVNEVSPTMKWKQNNQVPPPTNNQQQHTNTTTPTITTPTTYIDTTKEKQPDIVDDATLSPTSVTRPQRPPPRRTKRRTVLLEQLQLQQQ